MRIASIISLFALIGIMLTACQSNLRTPSQPQGPAGDFRALPSMNNFDREKTSKALDSALGKTTEWHNSETGISYRVTPTEKLTINGNSFCRHYVITTKKGSNVQQVTGTACINQATGSWQPE